MMKKIIAVLMLLCVAGFAQNELNGSYCSKTDVKPINLPGPAYAVLERFIPKYQKPKTGKECLEFKAGNKVVSSPYILSYTINGGNLVFVDIDKKAFVEETKKEGQEILKTMKAHANNPYEFMCATFIAQGGAIRDELGKIIKRYTNTQAGMQDCIKDSKSDPNMKFAMDQAKININEMVKEFENKMNTLKPEDIEGKANGEIKRLNSANYFVAGNTIHSLDAKCNSIDQLSKGTDSANLTIDEKTQFCKNGKIYSKCDGEGFLPGVQVCKDNTLFLKCGEVLYNPNEKYCPDGILKNKGEFTDSRDGKKYKTVVIGKDTWMAENLNFEAKGSKCYKGDPKNCEKYGRFYDWETAMNVKGDAITRDEVIIPENWQGICPAGWRLPRDKIVYDKYNKIISSESDWPKINTEKIVEETKKKIEKAMEARGETRMMQEEEKMLEEAEEKSRMAVEDFNRKFKPPLAGGTDEYGFNYKPGGYYQFGGTQGSAFEGIGVIYAGLWDYTISLTIVESSGAYSLDGRGSIDTIPRGSVNVFTFDGGYGGYTDLNNVRCIKTDAKGGNKAKGGTDEESIGSKFIGLFKSSPKKKEEKLVKESKKETASKKTEKAGELETETEVKMKAEPEAEKEEIAREEVTPKNNKEENLYGIRANAGITMFYPSLIQVGERILSMNNGRGWGLGAFVVIPFSSFHFVPEITVQHREPVKDLDLFGFTQAAAETAVEVPLLARFFYGEESSIYFGVGVFFGAVLDMQQKDGDTKLKDKRSSDYGFVLELGYRINENISLDIRGTASVASFGIGEYLGTNETPKLMQAQVGIGYVF